MSGVTVSMKLSPKQAGKLYMKSLQQEEEITKLKGLLMWTLYHHQGAHSDIGIPIRDALGIGHYDTLTDAQIEQGRAAASGA